MIPIDFTWNSLRFEANCSCTDPVVFDALFVRDRHGIGHDARFLLESPEIEERLREEAGLVADQLEEI
jgi:hypothetical protein